MKHEKEVDIKTDYSELDEIDNNIMDAWLDSQNVYIPPGARSRGGKTRKRKKVFNQENNRRFVD